MNTKKISADLHLHTTASDGSRSVEERIECANKIGLTAIGITDHDVIPQTVPIRFSIINGIELVSGTEVRAHVNEIKVEILGYFIEPYNKKLKNCLSTVRKFRHARNKKMIDKLQIITEFDDGYEELIDRFGGIIGRPHLARILVEEGTADSIQSAFDQYLGSEGEAFVEMKMMDAASVIKTIQAANGLAVLAHPGRIPSDNTERIVKELVEQGIDGVEVYYPYKDLNDYACNSLSIQDVKQMAEKFDLLITGGSDCHGPGSGKHRIGQYGVSEEQYLRLKQSANNRCSLQSTG